MPGITPTTQTGDARVNGLLWIDKWATSNLSFGFPVLRSQFTGYTFNDEPYNAFAPLDPVQQALVRAIFGWISSFTNLTFTELAGFSAGQADLRFGMSDDPKTAWAYLPDTDLRAGDSWYNASGGKFAQPVAGTYGYDAFIHEIGHTLGLKHPHDPEGSGVVTPAEYDSVEYSVMSYHSYPGSGLSGYTNGIYSYPQSYMMLDIAALQHLYGANFTATASDDVYGWSPDTGQFFVNGAGQTMPGFNRVFQTIWDGGGRDTYDFSLYATALSVDLRPGEWTFTSAAQLANLGNGHMARGHIANALLYQGDLRSLIEDAIGGSGDDLMIGNQTANALSGGGGADTLSGGGGNDALNGGGGDNDTALYAGNSLDYEIGTAGQVTVRDLNPLDGDEGTDTLTGIEYIQFADVRIKVAASPNHAPQLGDPAMADQSWADGIARTYVIPATSFTDLDGNNTLIFTATLSSGSPLPSWLAFDPVSRTLSGTPPVDQIGTVLEIRVTASDAMASISDNLLIGVTQAPGADVIGTEGPDGLDGTFRDESIFGLGGGDVLRGSAGIDRLDGGAGADEANYSASPLAVTIDLAAGTGAGGHAQGDVLISIERVTGSAFDDHIAGSGEANRIDGGAGADTMAGGLGDDVYIVDSAGDVVIELAGEGGGDEVRTALAVYSLSGLAEVERLSAIGDGARDFRGNGGDNVITGGGGNDFMRLGDGGNDTVIGGGGNDVILFVATLNGADSVDGGAGVDQVAIQGDYSGGITLGGGFVSVESFAILPGSDTRFGDPGTNFYDYNLTTVEANVAAGVTMVVDANRLRVGEDFAFNGSAETDGGFFIYGGGGTDTLLGGSGNDTFYFGENGQFGASDTAHGGAGGIDQLGLRGNYTITFGAGQLTSIESMGLVSAQDTRFGGLGTAYNYNLTMNDGNLAAGVRMTVDAAPLRGGETLTFDGSAEIDGSFRIFGGQGADTIKGSQNGDLITGGLGADTLRGGGGADAFIYRGVAESAVGAEDHVLDFTSGSDRIDLSAIDADVHLDGDQAFHFIGADAFTGAAGELRAAFDAGSGNWSVAGDVDGDGAADFLIIVTATGPDPIAGGDFSL